MLDPIKIDSADFNLVSSSGVRDANAEKEIKIQLKYRQSPILEPQTIKIPTTNLNNRAGVGDTNYKDFLIEKADKLPSEQKKRFVQHIDGMLLEPSLCVSELCDGMVKLSEAGFDLSCLVECSSKQKEAIIKYGSQMLDCGYKTDFTVDVCTSMVRLYEYRDDENKSIEDVLSLYEDKIVDFRGSWYEFQGEIYDYLLGYVQINGGSMKVLDCYHTMQRMASWTQEWLTFQGFCLSTRASLENENYFFGPSFHEDFSGQKCKLPNTTKKLIEYFDKISGKEVYVETMIIYRALIAIVLNYTNNPGLNSNKEKNMITVFHRMNDYYDGHLVGVARLTSLRPSYYNLKHIEGNRYSVVKMNIPFPDIENVFFLSFGMMFDERWIICNTVNAEVVNVTDVEEKE